MMINAKKHAALTIASKNYFALALTVAKSYLTHHPEHHVVIVLVDRNDGYLPTSLPANVEVMELTEIPIPDLSRFVYRYSILELNAAVKPFAMKYLFVTRGYETLVFIDPDLFVFAPLTHAYDSLARASILLTPHIRRPFPDTKKPGDLLVLQCGIYNLGFIALRNTESAHQLLDWWMSKLNVDCIVDVARGLFADQKWIDFVPSFFEDHAIIRHPGYNAAYWNLHERKLTRENRQWFVDGLPLAFFHFSGFSPSDPESLSIHQDRHDFLKLPVLRELVSEYAAELGLNGYNESSCWPYAFARLANGVELPLVLVREVMQWVARNNVPSPCPFEEPDQFCDFLLSCNVLPDRSKTALIWSFLLALRPDLSAAFPDAGLDTNHAGFRQWLNSSGRRELPIGDLLDRENRVLQQLAS
jgi:hypothetical protein